MVSYKISVLNKGQVKVIELEKIIKIKELRMLDEFTGNFINEKELKLYLLEKGLITQEELKNDIKITYKNNNQIKQLPVLYNKLKKYKDIVCLKNKLMSLSNDPIFLKELVRYYDNESSKYNTQDQNIYNIKLYLSGSIGEDDNIFEYEFLLNVLNNLFEKIVLKSVKEKDKKTINYRSQRELIFFINNYEESNKKLKDTHKESSDELTSFDINKNNLIFSVQTKNNEYEKESNLSSDGDPDFPFNSEEEEMYKSYMDNLPDEFIPYKR